MQAIGKCLPSGQLGNPVFFCLTLGISLCKYIYTYMCFYPGQVLRICFYSEISSVLFPPPPFHRGCHRCLSGLFELQRHSYLGMSFFCQSHITVFYFVVFTLLAYILITLHFYCYPSVAKNYGHVTLPGYIGAGALAKLL